MSAALALLTAALAATPCYAPADERPGWKRVLLPKEAPELAAPEDIPQFRTGEPALQFTRDGSAFLRADTRTGKLDFTFTLPPDSRRLELQFNGSLRGAKVDAVVSAGLRQLPVLDEKRVPGDTLAMAWELPGADRLVVTVHHHLRERPSLRHWTLAHLSVLAQPETTALSGSAPRSLYFLHPGNRHLTLCHAPGRQLTVDAALLQGAAEETALTATSDTPASRPAPAR